MSTAIVLLVLISAVMHPFWNLMIKKCPDLQFGFLCLTVIMCLCGLVHGLIIGADFGVVWAILPLIGVSVFGQILYGTCLTATLRRGDLSTYYPIIRSSPVVVVVFSVLIFGKSYPLAVLAGIAMAVIGGFLLLYRRGSDVFGDKAALGLALVAMCGTGIYSLADSNMMQVASPPVMLFFVELCPSFIYAGLWLRARARSQVPTPRMGGAGLAYLLLPGVIAYSSYYLILLAYQMGGEVAAVTAIRQASIPVSVALGGLFLREGAMVRRFMAAGLLAAGIAVIAVSG